MCMHVCVCVWHMQICVANQDGMLNAEAKWLMNGRGLSLWRKLLRTWTSGRVIVLTVAFLWLIKVRNWGLSLRRSFVEILCMGQSQKWSLRVTLTIVKRMGQFLGTPFYCHKDVVCLVLAVWTISRNLRPPKEKSHAIENDVEISGASRAEVSMRAT